MAWTKDSEQQESVRDLGVYEGGIYESNIYDRGWKMVDPDPESIRDEGGSWTHDELTSQRDD